MATRGRIEINAERCKGCELCTTVCPQNVIQLANWFNAKGYRPAQLVDPAGECTGCAVCAVICPDAVITVYRTVTPRVTVAAPAPVPGAVAATAAVGAPTAVAVPA